MEPRSPSQPVDAPTMPKTLPNIRGNTIDILAGLLKAQYNVPNIPVSDPGLRACVAMKFSTARNASVSTVLGSVTAMDEMPVRIATSLNILGNLPEGKLSAPTFAKELGRLEEMIAKFKISREEALAQFKQFVHERDDVVIPNILEKVNALASSPSSYHPISDQVIQSEVARIDKKRQEILYKFQQVAKEKDSLTIQLGLLHDKALDSLPIAKREDEYALKKGPNEPSKIRPE